MKIRVQDIYRVVERIKEDSLYNEDQLKDRGFKIDCPVGRDNPVYEEFFVYYDMYHGWMIDLNNKN